MTLIDPRPGLRELILSSGTVATLAGSRVFPSRMPQGETAPSVVYNRISELDSYHYKGPSGLVSIRFQIDCWAQTADEASELALAVKEQISGFSGTVMYGLASPPSDSIIVQGVFMADARDTYDDQAKLYGVGRDYFFWYGERG